MEVGEALECFRGSGAVLKLGILWGDDFIGPAKEQLPVAAWDPEHLRDHRDRDLRRNVAHEIPLLRCGGRIDDLARCKPDAGDAAVAAMLRRVYVEQMLHLPLLVWRQIARGHRQSGRVQEG